LSHLSAVELAYGEVSPGWNIAGNVVELLLVKRVHQDVIVVLSLHIAVISVLLSLDVAVS